MARKGSLTAEALRALGAEKLASLVLHEAAQNPGFKRLVSAALAGTQGPEAIVAVVRRRLAALERARSFVDWEKRKAFTADLKATLSAITNELGPADPAAAVEQLVRFLTTARAVFERVDDSSGQIQGVYGDAARALPSVAAQLSDTQKAALSERLTPLLLADGYGLIEEVVGAVLPILPASAIERLDAALAATVQESGPAHKGGRDWERRLRVDRAIRMRQAITDVRGDVDAYIALGGTRSGHPQDTRAIAERLLSAGRTSEALDWVRRPARPGLRVMQQEDLGDGTAGFDSAERERGRLEVRILEAMGDREAAQALRWKSFEASLDKTTLRDYLAHLPDFEEFEALDRAFAHAAGFPHRYAALAFFLSWPRLDLAAKLVLEHRDAWAGRHYGVLAPAAEALEDTEPRAATVLLYRALIDDILQRARSPAYGHAARYLARLEALAGTAEPLPPELPSHEVYRAALKQAHGRKAGFWSLVQNHR